MQQPIRLVDKLLPGPSGKRRRWTVADQFLVDEANSLLNGTPFTFGHVVVDEAQDHSAVSLRVIGRRSPQGSMTILGDLAQSTTPAGQQDWDEALGHIRASAAEVADLTIGYRVPGPILDVANRLLPLTDVSSEPAAASRSRASRRSSRSCRRPTCSTPSPTEVAAVRHRHHNTGVVAPAALHEAIGAALGRASVCDASTRCTTWPRRRAGVHRRGGEGPRVRRGRRGQPARDLRRLGTAAPACLRGDDPRRAGAAHGRRRPAAGRAGVADLS